MYTRVVERQVVYEGKKVRLEIHHLESEETGKRHKREVCVHPGAVCILPFVDPEHILLIRNRRYAVGQTLIELPAGTHAAPLSKVDPAEYGPNAEVTVDRGAVYEIISIEETPDRDSMFGETPRLIRARLIGYMED